MAAALQAAGHEGARQDAGLFIKPTTRQELEFYEWIVNRPCELASFVPLFMGTLTEQAPEQQPPTEPTQASSRSQEQLPAQAPAHAMAERTLIVLEDLCQGFDDPSIIDVKLGSELWDESASPEKRARLEEVSRTTTSGSLGFRIAGMTIVTAAREREAYGKQFGRGATDSTVDSHLKQFWPLLDSSDYIYSALVSVIAQLEQLHEALAAEPLKLRSASVLILYEGNHESLKQKAEQQSAEEGAEIKLVDVRLIDFAHTKRVDRPDEDVLHGLDELIKAFKRIQEAAS